jgi:hypothetical protein
MGYSANFYVGRVFRTGKNLYLDTLVSIDLEKVEPIPNLLKLQTENRKKIAKF